MVHETPWGLSQQQKSIGPGITRVWTAGHGGYHIDATTVSAMPPVLAAFGTWAGSDDHGGRWFEEDEDWCIVALAFPQHFLPYIVWCAFQTLERCAGAQPAYAAAKRDFTGPSRAEAERIADAWFNEHRDHWRLRGYGSEPGSGSIIYYEQLSSGATASRRVSAEEFRGLPPVLADLPGVPFTPGAGAPSTAT